MKVLDARESARQLDTNGWIEIKGNPISKVGVFEYSGKQLDEEGKTFEPNKIYKVYRPAESLSDPETIESFKLLPWLDDHPSRLLGSSEEGRIPAEKKGIGGVIGEDIYFDGKYLRGNIKVFSEDMAKKIQSGKIELSPGYLAKYELQDGNFEGQEYEVIQSHLRGNHLALVDQGRSGPDVRVLDHNVNDLQENNVEEEEKKSIPSEESKDLEEGDLTMGHLHKMLGKILDKLDYLKDYENVKDKKTKDNEEELEKKEKKTEDEEEEEIEEEKNFYDKKGSMDSSEIRRSLIIELSHRDKLAKNISPYIGVFDHSEMSLNQVAKYGVKKLGLNCKSGHEIPILEGYLAGKKNSNQSSVTLDSRPTFLGESPADAYLKEINKRSK